MDKKLINAIYAISDKNKKYILKSFGIKLSRKKISKKLIKLQSAEAVIDFYENKYEEILSETPSPFLPILFHSYLYHILTDLENVIDDEDQEDIITPKDDACPDDLDHQSEEGDENDLEFIVNTLQSLNLYDLVENDTCFPLFIELIKKILKVSKELNCSDPVLFLEPYDINLSIYLNSFMYYLNNIIYSQEELESMIDLFEECAHQFDNQTLLLQMYLFLLELLAHYEPFDKSITFINQLFEKDFSKNILVAESILNIAIQNDDEQLANIITDYVKNKKFFIIESEEDACIAQDIFEEFEEYKNKETLSIPYFMSPNFNKD